jgi:DNA-binding LacI/PurR family transcriptional regulator
MSIAAIRDVAAQARISIKTVSLVINNVPTVKPHTRERVLRGIRKLDYHPSPSARSLSGSRSYLIGLLYASCAASRTTARATSWSQRSCSVSRTAPRAIGV